MEDKTAQLVAEGNIDPVTKAKYIEFVKFKTQPKEEVKKKNFFESFIYKNKIQSDKQISPTSSNSSSKTLFDPFENEIPFKKVVKIEENHSSTGIRQEKKEIASNSLFFKATQKQEFVSSKSIFKNTVENTLSSFNFSKPCSLIQPINNQETKKELKTEETPKNKPIKAKGKENFIPKKEEEDILDLDEEISRLLSKHKPK